MKPTVEDIRRAERRIAPYIRVTPVITSRSIDEIAGARVFLKCENLQRVGAFKLRGACNALLSLSDEEARRGVATHSSGNHAAALALAARLRGVRAEVVMPSIAPAAKRAAVQDFGANVVFCAPTLRAREETLAGIVARTGAHVVHSYDDPRVIAGQGTAAMELVSEVPDLDAVVAPVGGGGLLSGTAIAVAAASKAKVFGAEPELADDAYRSLRSGILQPSDDSTTIADGLRTALSPLTFSVLRDHQVEVVTVSEDEIIAAMRFVWERVKLIIEASAAVPVAAVLRRKVRGSRIGVIVSGGNVDLDRLPWA